MKKTPHIIACILIIVLFQACTPTSNPMPTLNGLIENNSNYCGGAAPSDEIIEQLAIYHASSNQTFYVRQGNINTPFTAVYKTFRTDNNGNYSIKLPVGNYAVISQEKYNTESMPEIDSTCNYLTIPDFVLNVTTATQQTSNKKYTITCNYVCSPYLPQ